MLLVNIIKNLSHIANYIVNVKIFFKNSCINKNTNLIIVIKDIIEFLL